MLKSRHLVVSEGFSDLAVLEIITFHIRDLSEVLVAAIWEGSLGLSLDAELREPLSCCLQATAEVMRAWDEGNGTAKVIEEAQESLVVFTTAAAAVERRDVPSLAPGAAVALDLQRILNALQQRLLPAAPSESVGSSQLPSGARRARPLCEDGSAVTGKFQQTRSPFRNHTCTVISDEQRNTPPDSHPCQVRENLSATSIAPLRTTSHYDSFEVNGSVGFPIWPRRPVETTNPMERVTREIKERIDVLEPRDAGLLTTGIAAAFYGSTRPSKYSGPTRREVETCSRTSCGRTIKLGGP